MYKFKGTKAAYSIPFAIIDHKKIYLYMTMSFTSNNDFYWTCYDFIGNYKLSQKQAYSTKCKIYSPQNVNNYNRYLGYNAVIEFPNAFSLKKGSELSFLENDGLCNGCLRFRLIVKTVIK
jgi:hypothetical protein